MKHLNDLNRKRPFLLNNLLPEEISKNEPPAFFIPTHNIDYDFCTPNLEKCDFLIRDKRKKVFKKVGHATAVVSRLWSNTYKKPSMKPTASTYIKSTISTNLETGRKSRDFSISEPIKFIPYSINKSALFDKGCVTCGKDNIEVKYYGERHICLRCRNFLKTMNNDKAFVYINENGDIEAVGQKTAEPGAKPAYYSIETDKLWFKDYRCYASLAGNDELIVLLHDNQLLKKNTAGLSIGRKPILKEKCKFLIFCKIIGIL